MSASCRLQLGDSIDDHAPLVGRRPYRNRGDRQQQGAAISIPRVGVSKGEYNDEAARAPGAAPLGDVLRHALAPRYSAAASHAMPYSDAETERQKDYTLDKTTLSVRQVYTTADGLEAASLLIALPMPPSPAPAFRSFGTVCSVDFSLSYFNLVPRLTCP